MLGQYGICLVNALKNKLQNLAEQHPDVLESLTPPVRKRVEVLREIQGEQDKLEGIPDGNLDLLEDRLLVIIGALDTEDVYKSTFPLDSHNLFVDAHPYSQTRGRFNDHNLLNANRQETSTVVFVAPSPQPTINSTPGFLILFAPRSSSLTLRACYLSV
ncbi:hypothetical protein L6452_38022 [Arctium lappa]|uniref:Uncharacterized protein n=1 Tax=Arctium lappa TaxID=4217 RepID=A0ACB8Y8R0_ARCLA|nr:hypothetical protein L6452_38022 [Arctium lappa]